MNFPKLLFLCSVYSVLSFAQDQTQNHPGLPDDSRGGVTHVHTALGHVSLLEFPEPVTEAAAGSGLFHIERNGNKVLITPSKTGISTNLFVWTATRRFSYELDPPADPTSNLAIDAPGAEPKPAIDVRQQQTQFLTETFLTNGLPGGQRIDSGRIKPAKDAVTVVVQSVYRTNNVLYIYFVVDNESKQPFRMIQPTVYRLEADRSSISLWGLVNHQLDPKLTVRIGPTRTVSVPVADTEFQTRDLPAGTRRAGVIAVRLAPSSPTVLQMVFTDGTKATLIL